MNKRDHHTAIISTHAHTLSLSHTHAHTHTHFYTHIGARAHTCHGDGRTRGKDIVPNMSVPHMWTSSPTSSSGGKLKAWTIDSQKEKSLYVSRITVGGKLKAWTIDSQKEKSLYVSRITVGGKLKAWTIDSQKEKSLYVSQITVGGKLKAWTIDSQKEKSLYVSRITVSVTQTSRWVCTYFIQSQVLWHRTICGFVALSLSRGVCRAHRR